MRHSIAVTRYSTGSKFFHWLIAIIVIAMLSGSFFLDDLPKDYQGFAFMMHKSFGLTVLFLMILRFLWILYQGKPNLPDTVPHWQRFLAHFVQYFLYLGIISMAMCGWVMSVAATRAPVYFGLFKLSLPIEPNKGLAKLALQGHKTIAWILIGLVILHILGAVKHHFIDKDNVLKRMLPGG